MLLQCRLCDVTFNANALHTSRHYYTLAGMTAVYAINTVTASMSEC